MGHVASVAAYKSQLDRLTEATAKDELSRVAMRALLYACGHDDELPPPDDWVNAIDPSGESAFIGNPYLSRSAGRIAMNLQLAGKTVDGIIQPDKTVLFFKAKRGSPLAGGPALLQAIDQEPDSMYRPFEQVAAYLIAFVDGHVELVPEYRLRYLVWDAGAAGGAAKTQD